MSRNTEPVILRRLAGFVGELRTREIPQDVVHAAARCIVDWMAATIPGGVQPPATLLALALDGEVGAGMAVRVPSGPNAGGRAAALINRCGGHTNGVHDI